MGPLKKIPASGVPKGIGAEGKIVDAARWEDSNGDNFIVFSKWSAPGKHGAGFSDDADTVSAHLEAVHAVASAGATRNLRTLKDKEQNCDADLRASFLDAALSLTDLDHDGIGEITFGYVLNCATDMSSAVLKLVMLEDGARYILRGQTRVHVGGGEMMGGNHQVDAAFGNAPPSFLEHAKAQWLKVRNH